MQLRVESVRVRFAAFAAGVIQASHRPSVVIERNMPFWTRLDSAVDQLGDAPDLDELFTLDELRRWKSSVRTLPTGSDDTQRRRARAARERLEHVVRGAQAPSQSWLLEFQAWLDADGSRTRADRTRLQYLVAARQLLEHVVVASGQSGGDAYVDNERVAAFWQSHAGLQTNLSIVISYLRKRGIPVPILAKSRPKHPKLLRARTSEIRAAWRLAASDGPAKRAAGLTRLLQLLYRIPIDVAASLRTDQLTLPDFRLAVLARDNASTIELDRRLLPLFERHLANRQPGTWLFTNPRSGLPWSGAALSYHASHRKQGSK